MALFWICLTHRTKMVVYVHCRIAYDYMIRQLNRGLLQKTQTSKLPNLTTCARTPFWSFCAGQRRICPGQITDGTQKPNPSTGCIYFLPRCLPSFASSVEDPNTPPTTRRRQRPETRDTKPGSFVIARLVPRVERARSARTTRSAACDRKDDALAALSTLAVVELARRSWRGDWRSGSSGVMTPAGFGVAVTMTQAGSRRRDRCTHDEVGGARSEGRRAHGAERSPSSSWLRGAGVVVGRAAARGQWTWRGGGARLARALVRVVCHTERRTGV